MTRHKIKELQKQLDSINEDRRELVSRFTFQASELERFHKQISDEIESLKKQRLIEVQERINANK